MSDFLDFNSRFLNPIEVKKEEEEKIEIPQESIDRESSFDIDSNSYTQILASDYESLKRILINEKVESRIKELREKIENSTDPDEIEELNEAISVLEIGEEITYSDYVERLGDRDFSKEIMDLLDDERNIINRDIINKIETVDIERERLEYLLQISFPDLDENRDKIKDLEELINESNDIEEIEKLTAQKEELERGISLTLDEFNHRLSTRNSTIRLGDFSNTIRFTYMDSNFGRIVDGIDDFFFGDEGDDSSEINLSTFIREENSFTSRDLEFFTMKSIPYMINRGINESVNVFESITGLGDIGGLNDLAAGARTGAGLINGASGLFNFISMLTNKEMLKLSAINFLTMPYLRGIEIKSAKRTLRNPMGAKSFEVDGIYADFLYEKNKTHKEVLKLKNDWRDVNKIGHIYVYPANIDGGSVETFKIPFEFTPQIGDMGISAKYESKSMLGRIGSLQSYVNSEPDSISITTKYIALAGEAEEDRNATWMENFIGGLTSDDSWMSYFTLNKIQQIEMAYHSLALPQIIKTENDGVEYSVFHKPPIVKIKMGSSENAETSNTFHMLTYPKKNGESVKYYHKTFIVTNVKISKKLEESILEISKDEGIINAREFEVTLDLMEIDPNYVGQMPTAMDYFAVALKNNDLVG